MGPLGRDQARRPSGFDAGCCRDSATHGAATTLGTNWATALSVRRATPPAASATHAASPEAIRSRFSGGSVCGTADGPIPRGHYPAPRCSARCPEVASCGGCGDPLPTIGCDPASAVRRDGFGSTTLPAAIIGGVGAAAR